MSDTVNQDDNQTNIKFYSIGEVAKILNVNTSVIRYWEKEFPQITPLKTDYGRRVYTEDKILVLQHIKTLLYEDGMTIKGARNALLREEEKQQEESDTVRNVKTQLNDLLSYIRKEKQE